MYRGDFRLGDTFDIKFTTRSFSTGAPTQLAGTPSVAAYPGNSTTEITAGITLTVDFDTRTGLNNVRVVATSGNGYATATNYDLVITAGTVGGVSVVGEVIGSFSIENRSAVMPTTAGRTLDVSAGGEAGIDWANVGTPGSTVSLSATTVATVTTATTATNVTTVNGLAANTITAASIAADAITAAKIADGAIDAATFAADAKALFGVVTFGTMQAGSTGTSAVLASATSFADDLVNQSALFISSGTGAGQCRAIVDWVSATDTATVDPAWTTTPDNTSGYVVFATPPGSSTNPLAVNVVQFGGIAGTFASGIPEVKVASIANNAITATSIAADAITDAKVASDVTIASVTGAVGSVTGNVGGNVVGSVASVTAGVTVTTNNDKTGYRLSATGVDDIWDEATAGHTTAGTTGKALTDAGSAGDPWSTAVPGAYAAGTAGYLIGTYVDAPISTVDTVVDAIKAKTDNLPATPAATGDAMTLTSAYDFAKGTAAMTESYATDGAAMTPAQALHQIWSLLAEKNIASTTLTAKKLDGTTTAMTFTLDDATNPTSITRAS